jgi:hypothetical protein
MTRQPIIPWWLTLLFAVGNFAGVASRTCGFGAWCSVVGLVACCLCLGAETERKLGQE